MTTSRSQIIAIAIALAGCKGGKKLPDAGPKPPADAGAKPPPDAGSSPGTGTPGTPGSGHKFYDWPTEKVDRPHAILSTFGEYRGSAPDINTELHSGTDIPEVNVEVFSPDVGRVRRYGPAANHNLSAGSGPIRVGHFGFNHIATIHAMPGQAMSGVALPADLEIEVVEAGANVYVAGKANPDPTKDADFKTIAIPRTKPVVGYTKNGARYEPLTWWPRTLAIGNGVGPTDLHAIYYDTATGPYDEGVATANALEVLRNYSNAVKPVSRGLRLFTHAGNQERLVLDGNGTTTLIPTDTGAKLKVFAGSPFATNFSGIYELELEITCADAGPSAGHMKQKVWTFHKLPSNARSFDLVDRPLSAWVNVNNPKETDYVLTAGRNGTIDPAFHWELEDTTKWPDCRYTINVWVRNIKQSKGEGETPDLNEVKYTAAVDVVTKANGGRMLTVNKKYVQAP